MTAAQQQKRGKIMKVIRSSALAIAAALLASTALAADLPTRPTYKAPPAPVLFNWTGFYAGVHGGYAWGDADGWLAGGQLGVNYQPAGSPFVWGVEVDGAFTNIEDSATIGGISGSVEVDHVGTLRARFGSAADRTLYYVTGGLAWAHVDASVTGFGTSSNTHTGWTAGAGIEHAYGNGWSGKIEYLYSDFGSETYFGVASTGFDSHQIRLGLNYRFGSY